MRYRGTEKTRAGKAQEQEQEQLNPAEKSSAREGGEEKRIFGCWERTVAQEVLLIAA